ncbi:MAG: SOS response-associated peptidase family protein [Nitrospirales bacterium]
MRRLRRLQRPAFRSAFKKRRCLVIATGFYEG